MRDSNSKNGSDTDGFLIWMLVVAAALFIYATIAEVRLRNQVKALGAVPVATFMPWSRNAGKEKLLHTIAHKVPAPAPGMTLSLDSANPTAGAEWHRSSAVPSGKRYSLAASRLKLSAVGQFPASFPSPPSTTDGASNGAQGAPESSQGRPVPERRLA